MNEPKRQATDDELRAMRDAVYPHNTNPNTIQPDHVWESIKHYWRKDEAWLTEQYNKLKAKL